MNLFNIFKVTLLCFLIVTPLSAHNEFIRVIGGYITVTNNVSDAVKWESYLNIPLTLQFSTNLPSTLSETQVKDGVRDAYNDWTEVENGCVSFAEVPNGIQISFSTEINLFVNNGWNAAIYPGFTDPTPIY